MFNFVRVFTFNKLKNKSAHRIFCSAHKNKKLKADGESFCKQQIIYTPKISLILFVGKNTAIICFLLFRFFHVPIFHRFIV